eukprot:COSAG01_NODE_851_length_13121_cov_49.974044_14_plen_444_part_00
MPARSCAVDDDSCIATAIGDIGAVHCESLHRFWVHFNTLTPSSVSPVAAAPALAAWYRHCGAAALTIDDVFSNGVQMLTSQRTSDPIVPLEELNNMGLALFRHGLALESAQMHERARSLGVVPVHTVDAKLDRMLIVPSKQPEATKMGSLIRNMTCAKPKRSRNPKKRCVRGNCEAGTKLRPGRRCLDGDCHDRCAFALMNGLVSDSEAARLISHFELVVRRTPSDLIGSSEKVTTNLERSAMLGKKAEHLFFVRIIERLRAAAGAVFGISARRLRMASHFMSQIDSSATEEAKLHVDEVQFDHFHYTAIVWLNGGDNDGGVALPTYTGGEISFWQDLKQPWIRVHPVAGRAAFFSSGWENAHRVTPVKSGLRYALQLFLTAEAPPPPPSTLFLEQCVFAKSPQDFRTCEAHWAEWHGLGQLVDEAGEGEYRNQLMRDRLVQS